MKQRTADTHSVRRRLRLVALVLVGLLTVTALVGLSVRFARPLWNGPVLTALVVQGRLQHVSPAAIRAVVLPTVAGRGFFRLDMQAVQREVQSLPWVASAAIRRSWPHTLYISVMEEVPVARWNGDGLIDAQGKVFMHGDTRAYQALPLLSGPEGGAQDVLAEYNSLAPLTDIRGLRLARLSVDARGAASVQLSDGIEVRLGREAAQQRLERFGSVALPALGPQLSSVAYVDMRYTNGFAVGWGNPAAAAACQRRSGAEAQAQKGAGSENGCAQASATHDVKHKEVRPNV